MKAVTVASIRPNCTSQLGFPFHQPNCRISTTFLQLFSCLDIRLVTLTRGLSDILLLTLTVPVALSDALAFSCALRCFWITASNELSTAFTYSISVEIRSWPLADTLTDFA